MKTLKSMKQLSLSLLIALTLSCSQEVKTEKKKPIEYVDMFMGTGDDYGQNDPAPCVPYGMIKICPDSDPPNHAGYNFEQPRIGGISINRVSGVGSSGKGGSLRLKPCTGAYADEVRIVKETEEAVPGYYATKLDNGISMRLTATNNVGIEEFTFPENKKASFVIDLHSTFITFNGASFTEIAKDEVGGMVSSRRGHGNVYVQYFNLKSNVAFDEIRQDSNLVYLVFDKAPKEKVELRIAVSAIDEETAARENKRETRSFEEIKDAAYSLWADKLSKIELEGNNEEYKTIFYSCLYRNFLTPVNVTSLDGTYLALDGKIEKAEGFTYYSSWSTWDTYRTKFPLMTIVENDFFSDIYRSQVDMLGRTKKIWPTPTVRNDHAILVLVDALVKNIPGADLNKYYDILKQGKDRMPDGDPGGNLEDAYDVWAFAQIAQKLGHEGDYEKYMGISKNIWEKTWKEKFMEIDPATFDTVHGGGLYEGTLWQYRWSVPFDTDGLIELVGKEKLAGQLEYFFENDLYNHGNQPDIQAPFMFNIFGKPYLTQKWANTILTKEMTHRYGTHDKYPVPYVGRAYKAEPRAFIPEMDDDDATMSAWYVFASMGLYPLCPGKPEYQVSSPIFDKVTLHLDNGNTFTIQCNNLSDENIYIQSVALNGKKLDSFKVLHQQIMDGGTLEFDMGSQPKM